MNDISELGFAVIGFYRYAAQSARVVGLEPLLNGYECINWRAFFPRRFNPRSLEIRLKHPLRRRATRL